MKKLRPYLLLAVTACLAFLPVSLQLRALKNDILALEYPINFFISNSLRHGEIPYWFSTWDMGFPLQSHLTWGIFSTPRLLFSGLFPYALWTLHLEFMFYIVLAGWSMYYLLRKHFSCCENQALLLAASYMLSGFMVGSTQWLLYISAAALLPVYLHTLLNLVREPSRKRALQTAVAFALLLTSAYTAFTIVAVWVTLFFLLALVIHRYRLRESIRPLLTALAWTAAITLAGCGPVLYFTLELVQEIGRGQSLAGDALFFHSNYLPPASLSSLLFPLSSVKAHFFNTEGSMFHAYPGLFLLLLTPAALWQTWRRRHTAGWILAGLSLLFLLISFGPATPVRDALNILPGFSHFRNAGLFRLFFLLSWVLYIALTLGREPADWKQPLIRYTAFVLALVSLGVLVWQAKELSGFSGQDLGSLIKNSGAGQWLALSAGLQLLFLLGLIVAASRTARGWISFLLLGELALNTLLCTPFYSVSSYTLAHTNEQLPVIRGFPVQQETPGQVAASMVDERGNTWHQVNVFKQKVSSGAAYRGPLEFRDRQSPPVQQPLVACDDSLGQEQTKLILQRPTHVRVEGEYQKPVTLTLLQQAYPGWEVWVNGKKASISRNGRPGISVIVPTGRVQVDFRYRRPAVWISAGLLHLIVLAGVAVTVRRRRKGL